MNKDFTKCMQLFKETKKKTEYSSCHSFATRDNRKKKKI